MIKDIPVLVVQVLDYLSMSIAGFAENSFGLRRQTFIDLDKTEPLRGQEPLAPSRDCAIEYERVVIPGRKTMGFINDNADDCPSHQYLFYRLGSQ